MPRALITGASGGIGLELARILAREKHDLILVARSVERLEEIAQELHKAHKVSVEVIAKDLSLAVAAGEIYRQAGPADILINNAGFGYCGKFAETALDEHLSMMHLNMDALVALTRLYLPSMIEAGKGRVMNVASTAAFQPGPMMSIYYASKAFVLSFSEAIANELEGTGVTVTALCPGPTKTGFQDRAKIQDTPLIQMGMMGAKEVAEQGYRGLMAGKTIVIPGFKNRLGVQGLRLAPRKLVTKIVRSIQESRH